MSEAASPVGFQPAESGLTQRLPVPMIISKDLSGLHTHTTAIALQGA